jgi:glutamate dehydrogenase
MTTLSVRRNVTLAMAKIGLDPISSTKFQTGGPDGDLGSNEILQATEKTTSIVDGRCVCRPCLAKP